MIPPSFTFSQIPANLGCFCGAIIRCPVAGITDYFFCIFINHHLRTTFSLGHKIQVEHLKTLKKAHFDIETDSDGSFFFVGLQGFLACKTEEFDFDMDGEKAPICYKEITTALRQWILPTFVSPDTCRDTSSSRIPQVKLAISQ